ncbi:MAG: NAD(P)/FAD-dependent oxidoreductase [Clostridia bacterium]|nr:NAD(P)/FAD-dependent oxidoreductase [Clostridia bacterium]
MAKIIIIGGGVAGLCAGIYARLNGYEAVIYEAHKESGGNLTGWQRGPYHIDNCIHWLTGTNKKTETYKMWKETGALSGTDIYGPPSLYTYYENGQSVSLFRDIKKFEKQLLSLSPGDEKAIKRLISAVNSAAAFCGLKKQSAAGVFEFVKCFNKTTGQLSAKFRHPLIRGFLSSFLTDGFSAAALIIVFANFFYGNADLPRGGSKAMAERMEKRFLSLGGILYKGAAVKDLIHGGRSAGAVSLSDGAADFADYFIITSDPGSYKALTGRPLPKRFAKLYGDRRLKKFSSVHFAFSCKAPLPFTGDLMLKLPGELAAELGAKYIALREFSHEPGFAPAGETVLQAFFFCDERTCRDFIIMSGDGSLYKSKKKQLYEAVYGFIIKTFPALSGSLRLIDTWTPATYKKYTDSASGTYMSFAFSAGFIPRRLNNRADGFDNVFFATQWLQPPGGLPIAASAGRDAITAINRIEKLRIKNLELREGAPLNS